LPDHYGYSPISEIYEGLKHVIAQTLHNPDGCCSSAGAFFAEAKYVAAEIVSPGGRSRQHALMAEYAEQDRIYQELFDKLKEFEKSLKDKAA
jgi:hypothetical protein